MKRFTAILIAGVLAGVGQVAAAQAIHHKCKGDFGGQATACIKAPRDGATVDGASIKVTLTATDMGAAHYHLFLDTDVPAEGQAIPEAPGITHLAAGAKEFRLASVPAGNHRLIVALGDGGHGAIARQKTDTAYFTVPGK